MDTILTYRQERAIETVRRIEAAGWTFKPYSWSPVIKGWWVKADGSTLEQMRRGDPKEFYTGAETVAELYL